MNDFSAALTSNCVISPGAATPSYFDSTGVPLTVDVNNPAPSTLVSDPNSTYFAPRDSSQDLDTFFNTLSPSQQDIAIYFDPGLFSPSNGSGF